ncbi:MAG: hypothetical protein EXR69_16540 [Myxococcales bacterium]|nr:hypothetical protein [Myxococcales bacterium]
MSVLVVATARDEVRTEVLVPLSRAGIPVRPVADWESLCRAVAGTDTRLVLVDSELPNLDPLLLDQLARSMSHAPRVRVMGGKRPPLTRIPVTRRAAEREAMRLPGSAALTESDRDELRWFGFGAQPLDLLARLAASPLPICVHGERGTGKARIARWVHRLSSPDAAFVEVPPGQRWERVAGRGTVFIEGAHRREPGELRALARDATALGWRFAVGTRAVEAPTGVDWVQLAIPPMRAHPADIRPLATAYLGRHCQRMGLPLRTLDRELWSLLVGWRWPGNHRELEMFIVQLLTQTNAVVLRAKTLPDSVARLLRAEDEAVGNDIAGFEDVAEARLRDVVNQYSPGPGVTLHTRVMDAAERALFRLALGRTGGNRKATSALLGIARNTLASRSRALGIEGQKED